MDSRRQASELAFALFDFLVMGDQKGLEKQKTRVQSLLFVQSMLWRELERARLVRRFFNACLSDGPFQNPPNRLAVRDCSLDALVVCGTFGADLLGSAFGQASCSAFADLVNLNKNNLFCSGVIRSVQAGIEKFILKGYVDDLDSCSGLALAVASGIVMIPFAVTERFFTPSPDLAGLYGAPDERQKDIECALLMLHQLPAMADFVQLLSQNAATYTSRFNPSISRQNYSGVQARA